MSTRKSEKFDTLQGNYNIIVIAFYCLSQEKNLYYLVRSHFIRKFYGEGIVFILFIFAFFVHFFDFYNNDT